MRCLALGQAWQEAGGRVTFFKVAELPVLEKRLVKEGMSVRHLQAEPGSELDAHETTQVARELGATWVVVDGYCFDRDFYKAIKNAGLRLCILDDLGGPAEYVADIIINQNIHAKDDLYGHRASYSRLLLGTQYALLRKEFTRLRGWVRDIADKASKVLVTMGGSDPENATLKVLQGIVRTGMRGLDIRVVVGAGNSLVNELRAVASMANNSIRIEGNVEDMAELMMWADVAVSAGGSTCWELAFMGLPCAILVLSKDQEEIAAHMQKQGAGVNLGWHGNAGGHEIAQALEGLIGDGPRRKTMSACGRRLVDGLGAQRVVENLVESEW